MKLKSLCLALGACFLLSCGNSNAIASNDKVITQKELPAPAQTFIKKHFPKAQVSLVKLDTDILGRSYEVILSDGCKLEFDKSGQWTDLDGQRSPLPVSSLPQAIVTHVRKNFSANQIVQIERTDRKRYAVELDNGVELLFDKNFRFLGYDD